MKKQTVEYSLYDVSIYANGICNCSVCALENMPTREVDRIVNIKNPSSVNPWKISKERFNDGTANPHTCERDSNRVHYLLNC